MTTKFLYTILLSCLLLQLNAQDRQRFSPLDFQAKLKEYIVKETEMTPEEATKYFTLYDELNQKRRSINEKMHTSGKGRERGSLSDKEYTEIINQNDQYRLDIVKLEIEYNKKYLKAIPAKKVFGAQKAEQRFHRRMLQNASGGNMGRQGGGQAEGPKPHSHQIDNKF